jgi:hypothetical protein
MLHLNISRQITKVPDYAEVCTSTLFVHAGCADLSKHVLLDDLAAFVNDVHQTHAIHAAVSKHVGDVEVAEGSDQLPLAVVQLPDFVLVETIQSPVSSRQSRVVIGHRRFGSIDRDSRDASDKKARPKPRLSKCAKSLASRTGD